MLRDRRARQRLLPAAGSFDFRPLGLGGSRRLRISCQGKPIPDPRRSPQRTTRACQRSHGARTRPRLAARPRACPATAEPGRRVRSPRTHARGVPSRGPGPSRAPARELVRSRGVQALRDDRHRLLPDRRRWPSRAVVENHGLGSPPVPSRAGQVSFVSWTSRRPMGTSRGRVWPKSSDVFAYFNNDGYRCAPRHARRFALALRKHALSSTCFPAARDVPLSSG